MENFINNEIDQIKLYPPGSQKIFEYITSCNSLYFCYCTTISVIIYDRKLFRFKSIICPNTEIYLHTAAINKGESQDLAVFYDFEIIVYSLITEKPSFCLPISGVIFLEFNQGNKLLAVTSKGTLHFFDLGTVKGFKNDIKAIKTSDKVIMAQWYPFNTSDLAYITNKNEVYYQSILKPDQVSHVSIEIKLTIKDCSEYQITEMAWYDADENYKYLLIGTNTSYITLVDLSTNNPCIISTFEHYGNGIKRLVWLTYEPGSFISITKNCGRISTWNVSKTCYNQIIKLTDFAVKSCIKFDNETIFFTTSKGEIVLYNMKQKKKIFYIDSGHCESIYDIKYNPFTYGLLASCSNDGSIKIWNTVTNTMKFSLFLDLNHNQIEKSKEEKIGVLCVKWSPLNENLLVSGDNKGGLKIWDIAKEKQVASMKFDAKNKTMTHPDIVGVDWNDDNEIVCACHMVIWFNSYANDKFTTVKSIMINTSLYQIKYNPFNSKEVACACKDGNVRLCDIDKGEVIKVYNGHKEKAYGISFSKSKRLLASSGDDFRIGIWNTEKDGRNENNFLLGHTDNIRQLLWLDKASNILISGSWDSTIRFWNIDQMICVGLINEHLSDVYGLDINPSHPYLIASSSRDNTIRFWNYLKHPLIAILDFLNKDFDSIKALTDSTTPIKDSPITRARVLSNYYLYEDGISEFWKAAEIMTLKSKESSLINEYTDYIYSIKALEDSYFTKGKIDFGNKRKEDVIKKMTDKCAKSGQWQKYCELCIKNNDWENAIMSAPHVSIDYWKSITEKYAQYSSNADFNSDIKLNSFLLSNDATKSIQELFDRGDYEDAKIVLITRANQHQSTNTSPIDNLSLSSYDDLKYELNNCLIDESWKEKHLYPILSSITENRLIEGKPLVAAYHYLSIRDINKAMKILVQGNQLEIAYLLMKSLNCYLYEEDILLGIIRRKKNYASSDELINIINQCNQLIVKVIIFNEISSIVPDIPNDIINALKREIDDSDNALLQAVFSKNINVMYEAFMKESQRFIDLLTVKNPNASIDVTYCEMMKKYQLMKGMKLDMKNPLCLKLKVRMLACAANIEIINGNVKGAYCLLKQLLTYTGSNYDYDNNDVVSIKFTYDYLNNNWIIKEKGYCLRKFDKETIEGIINNVKSSVLFPYEYYEALYNTSLKFNDFPMKKYICEGKKHQKFFYIKMEDFPKNYSATLISSFSQELNKNNGIQLENGLRASLSEYMELRKYSCQ